MGSTSYSSLHIKVTGERSDWGKLSVWAREINLWYNICFTERGRMKWCKRWVISYSLQVKMTGWRSGWVKKINNRSNISCTEGERVKKCKVWIVTCSLHIIHWRRGEVSQWRFLSKWNNVRSNIWCTDREQVKKCKEWIVSCSVKICLSGINLKTHHLFNSEIEVSGTMQRARIVYNSLLMELLGKRNKPWN